MKNYIENKIFNNHLLYREYDPSQTSALLYTNDTEITGYSINNLFSVSVPADFPYVAVKFDWYSTSASVWAYNRDVCGVTVRGHFGNSYQGGLQKVCKPLNYSSAMNEATIYTADDSTDIAANNTNESTYTTINYAWHNNATGFSAAVAGIWRYRDARINNISTLSNITCTNEQGGSFRRMFYCKNVRIACFNNAEDCLKTTW
jgi:hypothetical protein